MKPSDETVTIVLLTETELYHIVSFFLTKHVGNGGNGVILSTLSGAVNKHPQKCLLTVTCVMVSPYSLQDLSVPIQLLRPLVLATVVPPILRHH